MAGLLGGAKQKPIAYEQPAALGAIKFQTSVLGLALPIVYGQTRISANVLWYGDFVAIAHSSGGGGGGGGGGKGGGGGGSASQGQTTYTYAAAMALGLCEGPVDGIGDVWQEKNKTSLSTLGLSLFSGSYPQSPWGYLTTNHPGHDLAYAGIAYVASANYDLGDNAQLPNHTFEVKGRLRFDPDGGIVDCDPADVVEDLLTNANYGAGFPAGMLADLANYSDYCVATGLFVSIAMTDQQEAQQWLDDLLKITNSEALWSAGTLKILPRGDEAASGNGATYTPDMTPAYDLDDDDFLVESEEDAPVTCIRSSPADAYNQVQVEILDRANEYNTVPVDADDLAAIDTYGRRPADPVKAHSITSQEVGRTVVQLLLQRELYQRNQYNFRLSARYSLLEPMDLVTITDSGLHLDRQLVRILSIEEDDNFNLDLTVEQVEIGTANSAIYASQAASGFTPDYNADPGDANEPIIFDVPQAISRSGGLEVWMGVSGQSLDWGGCQVWISTDGTQYAQIGEIRGNARTGELTDSLSANGDPDLSSTLAIDLSESRGSLLSGSQADVDLFSTLCYVDDGVGTGEFLAYRDATLTGANEYALTYLRRGCYGTEIDSHLTGARFVRLDSALFAYPYAKAMVGATIWIKLVGFNVYGGALQQIDDVDPVTYVIQGPPGKVLPPGPPSVAESLYVTRDGSGVKAQAEMSWAASTDVLLRDYLPEYRLVGATAWLTLPRTTGLTALIEDIGPGIYDFSVRAISDLALDSERQVARREIVGLGAPPSALQNLTISAISSLAILRWDLSPDLDVRIGGRIEFRHAAVGTNWQESVSIGNALPGSATVAVLPLKPGTYMAKAYDSSNIASAVAIVLTEAATILEYANLDTLTEDPTFSGTKTNLLVDDGELMLGGAGEFDDIPDFDAMADLDFFGGVSSSGTYEFGGGIDLGLVTRARLSSAIEVLIVNTLDQVDSRSAMIDAWQDFDGTNAASADAWVEARATGDDPGDTPVWGAWDRLDVAEYNARAFEFRLRMVNSDPAYNITVSALSVSAEELA